MVLKPVGTTGAGMAGSAALGAAAQGWQGFGVSGAPLSQVQPHPAFHPPRVFSTVVKKGWGADSKRYPSNYPFLPGQPHGVAVQESGELVMSHIPQMRAEFARLKADDIRLLHFLDELATVGGARLKNYEKLTKGERQGLAKGLRDLSIDLNDKENVRWHLSRITRMYGIRYPEHDCPERLLLPLMIAMKARMVNAELSEPVAQAIFYHPKTLAYIRDHFDRGGNDLTPLQAKRLAKATLFMTEIFYESRPFFQRSDALLPALCIFKEGLDLDLPEEFRKGPSRFIEKSRRISRGKATRRARVFYYLNRYHLDADRVKRFKLGKMKVVSKRIEAFRVERIEEEIFEAEKFRQFLQEEGIEGCRTVEYIGIVYDKGNFYILMRDEGDGTLYDTEDPPGLRKFHSIKGRLEEGGLRDAAPRNVFHRKRQLVFFDFEDHSTAIQVQHIPPNSDAIAFAGLSWASTERELGRLKLGRAFHMNLPFVGRFRDVLALERMASSRPGDLPTNAVISDIHGNVGRLRRLLDHPHIETADKRIFLGDYFDRDSDGIRVFDMLREWDFPRDRFLLGNHELYFLLAMAGDEPSFIKWLADGGLDFLNGVVDLSVFSDRFFEIRDRAGESSMDLTHEIILTVRDRYPRMFEDFYRSIRENEFLKGVADWLIDKCGLYHVDEYALLYIHAGIMATGGLDIGYLDRLSAHEKGIRSLLRIALAKDDEATRLMLKERAMKIREHLEIREGDWVVGATSGGPENLFEVLSGIGVRGVVYGHTQRLGVSNSHDRLFNVDLSMGVYYGGGMAVR